VLEVTDMQKLKEIIDDPANAEMQERHSVLRPITLSMPVAL